MKTTATPALTMPEFKAAGINLATLGINLADPAADRVRDGLAALRTRSLTKATDSRMRIKQTMPGLTPTDAKQLAHAINNKQMSDGMGAEGKKVALEVAVRLADTLDAYHGYFDMLDAVPLDLSDVASYVDPRTWAATPRHVQQLVPQFMETDRKLTMKQVRQEIENLMAMLHQVDNVGGIGLELFERRRLQREGLLPKAIEKVIAEMKADGRIPAAKEGGATV
ncbi:hypothetical protein Q5H92_22785 [Hymenobacter sp. M29]|uniref:Uncharacterized protein n=1 Tax=Hymenobacter mellowenesis TaxID=3063995 RepID=A0ABT9AH58_9BACT|nr:hypothetical protein [Hymenobacter sp. M29]MDO7849208.1 hypothetical protein [Hymenobacter sp. M29]